MTTMGHLSVWRWKDVPLTHLLSLSLARSPLFFLFLKKNLDFFFFDSFLSFICLSVRSSISYHMLLMNQNVESVFHPWQAPSSCEQAAVCLAASAATYQHTYFRRLVPHAVIRWQQKTWAFCIILRFFSGGRGFAIYLSNCLRLLSLHPCFFWNIARISTLVIYFYITDFSLFSFTSFMDKNASGKFCNERLQKSSYFVVHSQKHFYFLLNLILDYSSSGLYWCRGVGGVFISTS